MDDNRPRTLKDVAQAASDKHGGAHGRKLGEIAQAAGLTLSYTTVDKILAGTYRSRPKPPTLEALSKLSGVKRADVYAAAGVPMPLKPLAEDLPPGADLLSPGQRRVVIDVVREFAKMQRELHDKRAGEGHESGSPSIATLKETDAEILLADQEQPTEQAPRPGPGTPHRDQPG